MDRSGEVISRARSQVDRSCYVWGCVGQDLCAQKNVESFVKSKETQGDQAANVQRVMKRYQKLRNKGMTSILCFDCSGFIYWDFKAFAGLIGTRTNAAGLYRQCEDKQRGELRAGDLVFVHNGSRITHVGLYSGEGMVIHCKGRDVGVIEELISKHGWNRYGRWPLMSSCPDGQMLRGNGQDCLHGEAVCESGGALTGRTEVTDDDPPEPGKAYVLTKGTVKIRKGPGTDWPAVGVSGKKDKFLWLGDDEKTGWHEIEYKGEPVWITGKKKYTEVVQ